MVIQRKFNPATLRELKENKIKMPEISNVITTTGQTANAGSLVTNEVDITKRVVAEISCNASPIPNLETCSAPQINLNTIRTVEVSGLPCSEVSLIDQTKLPRIAFPIAQAIKDARQAACNIKAKNQISPTEVQIAAAVARNTTLNNNEKQEIAQLQTEHVQSTLHMVPITPSEDPEVVTVLPQIIGNNQCNQNVGMAQACKTKLRKRAFAENLQF